MGWTSSSQSGKKRIHESATPGKSRKKANTNPGGSPRAKTDKRTDPEQAYLKKHGLCYHCVGKKDLEGKPFPHRGDKCPFKNKGIPCAAMPLDFNPKDFLPTS